MTPDDPSVTPEARIAVQAIASYQSGLLNGAGSLLVCWLLMTSYPAIPLWVGATAFMLYNAVFYIRHAVRHLRSYDQTGQARTE